MFPVAEFNNILFHPFLQLTFSVEGCNTISLVPQPSRVYLQSLPRVHSVLSYGSVLRVLRNTRPSTEPWRALPGTGFCHWSQPFQPSSFSFTSLPVKSTLLQFLNYDVIQNRWKQQHPHPSPHSQISHLITEISRVHQAWFPLLLFFKILNSPVSWATLLPTPTSSISLSLFLIPALAGHLPPRASPSPVSGMHSRNLLHSLWSTVLPPSKDIMMV